MDLYGSKIKYFYNKQGKLVATLITNYSEITGFRVGYAVAKKSEDFVTKKVGKIIAHNRLSKAVGKMFINNTDLIKSKIPNRVVMSYKLREVVGPDGSTEKVYDAVPITLREAMLAEVTRSYSIKVGNSDNNLKTL